jgi:hypothetical protein
MKKQYFDKTIIHPLRKKEREKKRERRALK